MTFQKEMQKAFETFRANGLLLNPSSNAATQEA